MLTARLNPSDSFFTPHFSGDKELKQLNRLLEPFGLRSAVDANQIRAFSEPQPGASATHSGLYVDFHKIYTKPEQPNGKPGSPKAIADYLSLSHLTRPLKVNA